jgi:hypothetical protein
MGPQFIRGVERPMSVLLESINRLIDHTLLLTYSDLQEITAQLNQQSTVHELLDFSQYQLHYNSISRRLLELKAFPLNSISECFRLGLLAFLASATFRSPKAAPHAHGQFAYLTENYRQKCRSIDLSTPHISTLLFWLLTIGAISVFDIDEEVWLVKKWNAVTMTIPGIRLAWEDARSHLETVLWIRDAHEEIGKKAYQRLMRSDLQQKESTL